MRRARRSIANYYAHIAYPPYYRKGFYSSSMYSVYSVLASSVVRERESRTIYISYCTSSRPTTLTTYETPCANNAVFLHLFHAGAGPGAGTGPDANQGAESLRNSKSCLSMELAFSRLGHFVWRLFCSLLLCCGLARHVEQRAKLLPRVIPLVILF